MDDLFGSSTSSGEASAANEPLAEKLRPKRLEDVIGQTHLLNSEGPIGRMVQNGRLSSAILWGPPGSGKTTIARLLASQVNLHFKQLSAVFSGVSDLRKAFEEAELRQRAGRGTLLFVDEIHRFNKAQQDSFLPFVEKGTVVLLGATTENPSFELNAALLSRCQVLVLNRLDDAALEMLLARAEEASMRPLPLTPDARMSLRAMADGDGRYLLNMAELIFNSAIDAPLDNAALADLVQKRAPLYDKAEEAHYNLISALHKSLRGSDVDAALYWLARMLVGGERPLYILRRLVRFAVEDIGLADPNALLQATAAKEAYDFLGSPEGELAIVQSVIYLATAPKSNAVYKAEAAAKASAANYGSLMPPFHILNAPTKMMQELGYGEGYAYDHDAPDGFSGQNYFPDAMERQNLYRPSERGFEREVTKRLQYWSKLRAARESSD